MSGRYEKVPTLLNLFLQLTRRTILAFHWNAAASEKVFEKKTTSQLKNFWKPSKRRDYFVTSTNIEAPHYSIEQPQILNRINVRFGCPHNFSRLNETTDTWVETNLDYVYTGVEKVAILWKRSDNRISPNPSNPFFWNRKRE